jgi:hypothetical protein
VFLAWGEWADTLRKRVVVSRVRFGYSGMGVEMSAKHVQTQLSSGHRVAR